MPRHQRILSKTGTYHVMMRGNERKNLFLDENDKQRFYEIMFAKKKETGFFLYAYCLMDNHIHLLIREGPENLATTMKRLNTSYAYYFNHKNYRIGHLFQDRFKSEPIEDERYLLSVIRYIHNNPIKAGIVAKPEAYQWSSYRCYLSPEKSEARIVEAEYVLSMISSSQTEAIREFKKFSNEQDDTEHLDYEEINIWTMEEGESYLDDYLKTSWPGIKLDELMKNNQTSEEIISNMRKNTGLSIRKIADLLGINRGIVQRAKGE